MRLPTSAVTTATRGLLLVVLLAARAGADIQVALELVPKDACGGFLVPSLKRCSDELAACLERVDRAEALLAGRPIDLAKARLGIVAGVRDDGALVGVLRPAPLKADGVPRGTMRRTLLVPVTDADAFLANFDRESVPGLLRRPDGTLLHSAVVMHRDRRWVALSETADGVADLAPDPDAAAAHRESFGSSAERLLDGTDVIAWITGTAIVDSLADLPDVPDVPDVPGARRARSMASSITLAAFAWDIDALGLLGRGVLRVEPSSELGAALAGGTGDAARNLLDRLPDAAPYWAIGVDLEGLGGRSAFDALAAALGVAEADRAVLRAWLDGVARAQFAAYPSRLGVAVGGLLNDSAVVFVGPDPTALHRRAIERLEALGGERPGARRELLLERGRALKDAGSADAFELKETVLAGGNGQSLALWSMSRSILFGSRGVHGLLGSGDDALVMTFSQRPDVWRRAREAAAGPPAAGTAVDRLGEGAVIAAMRGYGLARVDVEGMLGMAQLARVLRQIASMIPGGGDAIPEFDFGPEPIYGALDVDGHQVHGAIVVPSGVVGVMLDLARQSQLGR